MDRAGQSQNRKLAKPPKNDRNGSERDPPEQYVDLTSAFRFWKRTMVDEKVWSAVKEGSVRKLTKLLNSGKASADIGQHTDNFQWTLLHHAAICRSLDVVKLVAERCNPDVIAETHDGATPLAVACEQSVAAEIIVYLLLLQKDKVSMDEPGAIISLQYAVLHNRADLARELVALGVKVTDPLLRDSISPLYLCANVMGNKDILKCLLDAANVEVPFVADERDGLTMLDVFAARAEYATERKIACFEIIYHLGYPDANAGGGGDDVRYNVEDILKPAMLSHSSTSLIEYFIEIERKWETRPEILSLYGRMVKFFPLLSLLVLCVCGPVSNERKVLDDILREPCLKEIIAEVGDEMETLFRYTIRAENETIQTDPMQLLGEFATFAKSVQLECVRNAVQSGVQVALLTNHLMLDKPLMKTMPELVAYQPIIDCMVSMCGYNRVDGIVETLLNDEEQLLRSDLVFPLLKHCTTLFMCPDDTVAAGEQRRSRLLQWFLHLFGTWKTVECFSKPQLHVFTLKRLARDVVRETVWNGIDAAEGSRKRATFFDRLESIVGPNEVKGYLRYSDHTSMQYFLYHMHDTIDYFKESRNLGGERN